MTDYTKINIERFDKEAALWDSRPTVVALANESANAFLQVEAGWDAKSTVVIEFACGTGTRFPSA